MKASKCVPCYRNLGGVKVLSGSLEDARYVDLLHIMGGARLLCAFQHNTYQLSYIYIYSIPPDDGLQICPKYIEFD